MGYCIECRHSHMGVQLGSKPQLLCRRYPPKLTPLPAPNGIQIAALHPAVDTNNSCGEFVLDEAVRLSKEDKPSAILES